MTVFFLTLAVVAVVIVAMSVGVLFANKPIKGSCGGMSAIGIDTECDICGGNTAKCEEEQKKTQKSQNTGHKTQPGATKDLAYDASKKQ